MGCFKAQPNKNISCVLTALKDAVKHVSNLEELGGCTTIAGNKRKKNIIVTGSLHLVGGVLKCLQVGTR